MRPTPKYGHAPIRMVEISESDDRPMQLGEFYWHFEDGQRCIVIGLPMNKNLRVCPAEWTIDHKNHCGASWEWDGNEERPTLKPSLHWEGTWHGWVRNGMLIEA